MTTRRSLARVALIAAALLMSAPPGRVLAGPLSPPPGPVAPTGRIPITAVPLTINGPGTYYLTGDLTAPSSTDVGITVLSPGVTIDLNGFTLSGTGITAGLAIRSQTHPLVVRGGTIRLWSGGGIECAARSELADLLLTNNGSGEGIADGIDAGPFSRLVRCTVGGSNYGVRLGSGSVMEDCDVSGCEYDGILGGDRCRVVRTRSGGNGVAGASQIAVGAESLVEACRVSIPGSLNRGISVGADSVVAGCSVRRLFGGTVGAGISAGDRSRVERCFVEAGLFDEISAVTVGGDSWVTDCVVVASGIGIRTTGSRSLIRGNRVAAPITGIEVGGSANLVVANAIIGAATPLSAGPGNVAGQVLSIPGGGTIPGGDPWANLAY